MSHPIARHVLVAAIPLVATFAPSLAAGQERADAYLEPATNRPFEIEPHFAFGAENVYGSTGVGAGLRVGVPIAAGRIGRFADDVSLSFGGDWIHYDNCYFGSYCSANYLMVPVAAQWNVAVASRVSVFAEGGLFVYKGWYSPCGPGDGPGCDAPSDFGVLPTLALGGRYHASDSVALTLRIGYPTVTFGVSFL